MTSRAARGFVGHALTLAGVGIVAFVASCSRAGEGRPQVVVVVDTDAPVPTWVDRLSVEIYSDDLATKIDERDYPMPNPSDWPLSFGVRHEPSTSPFAVRLRLRAYDSTHLRSIYSSQDATLGAGVASADPITVIDRLARVYGDGQSLTRVRVVLRAECLGAAADLAGQGTCVDNAGVQERTPLAVAASGANAPDVSEVGTWPAASARSCTGSARAETGLHDEDMCIPGGVLVMGDAALEGAIPYGDKVDPVPERIAQISPFFLDRFEVSVARFRAAMRAPVLPFVPPVEPHAGGSPLTCGEAFAFHYCTWRGVDALGDPALDELPLNCVTFETAQAYCTWAGGDLPSEAQWEYAATRAFKNEKSPYPWLGTSPTCGVSSFGRWTAQTSECGHETTCGPLPVGAPFGAGPRPADCVGDACTRDETPGPYGKGVVGLAGNIAEWVRDLQVSYKADCWRAAPRIDPACESSVDPTSGKPVTTHMFRGGSWSLASWLMNVVLRTGGVEQNPLLAQYGSVGFRCMRKGDAR